MQEVLKEKSTPVAARSSVSESASGILWTKDLRLTANAVQAWL